MSPNKKADLQRKLTLARVPRPPAGLAERIKSDIPKDLRFDAEKERQRFSRTVTFNIRVAASILLLVSSTYLCLHLLSTSPKSVNNVAPAMIQARKEDKAPVAASATVADRQLPSAPVSFAGYQAPADQVTAKKEMASTSTEVLQTARSRDDVVAENQVVAASGSALAISAPKPAAIVAEGGRLNERRELAKVSAAKTAVAAPAAVVSGSPAYDTAFMQPPVASPAPPPEAPAAARAASPQFIQEATAEVLDLRPPSSMFGISIDHDAFDRVKSQIDHGERPAAGSVNVEALTNYFAGPASHSTREVKLETEGSPTPLPGQGEHLILRFTIDTASAQIPEGSSLPPIASDARLDIDFDAKSVASYRRLGGGSTGLRNEASLVKNTSVTAVYDIQLQPHAWPYQRVVTVRLQYRSTVDGKEHTLARTLHRRDMAPTWARATRRHRLASLAAIWGESLKENASDLDIARRAEELARQEPSDAKARELAAAVTASARLGSSSPTGSGGRLAP